MSNVFPSTAHSSHHRVGIHFEVENGGRVFKVQGRYQAGRSARERRANKSQSLAGLLCTAWCGAIAGSSRLSLRVLRLLHGEEAENQVFPKLHRDSCSLLLESFQEEIGWLGKLSRCTPASIMIHESLLF